MSPEQARGETEVDARADVHALGVILYELLCGHTPYRGDSFNAVIHQIATQTPLPLRSAGREFPEELEQLVKRTLASNPADRPLSAGQLAKELSPFARREVWSDASASPSGESAREDTSGAEHENVADDDRSFPGSPLETSDDRVLPARRWVRPASIGALVAAAVLLVAGWFATRSSVDPGTSQREETARLERALRDTRVAGVATRAPPSIAPVAPSGSPPSTTVSTQIAPSPALSLGQRSGNGANGRTSGRPTKSVSPGPTASKHATSDGVVAAFDTQNPYD